MSQQPRRGSQAARIAAVVSALVLVGLYVVYRSGGQTTLPSSKFSVVRMRGDSAATATTTPATAPALQQAADLHLFSGSKSAAVFSSSKGGVVFHPAGQAPSAANAAAAEPFIVLTTQPATAPAAAAQPSATSPAKQP